MWAFLEQYPSNDCSRHAGSLQHIFGVAQIDVFEYR